jgi:hypothetical protein
MESQATDELNLYEQAYTSMFMYRIKSLYQPLVAHSSFLLRILQKPWQRQHACNGMRLAAPLTPGV